MIIADPIPLDGVTGGYCNGARIVDRSSTESNLNRGRRRADDAREKEKGHN
jgi:hypothetical protein